MILQFLGTAASPSMPIPFCECEICEIARRIGGKNYRKRSSVRIDDDLLIDIGPDTASSSFSYGFPLTKITICLQTHLHKDHFDPEFIVSRHPDYGSKISKKLILAGSKKTLEMIDMIVRQRCNCGSIFNENVQKQLKVGTKEIKPFESYNIGDYLVIGYPANHDLDNDALLYTIEKGDNRIFYGTDTSVISKAVWTALIERNRKYDLFILDHTYGIGYQSTDHLATKDFIKHVQIIRREKLLKDDGAIYATHLSHEGLKEHDEFNKFANDNGYSLAYDGLKIAMR